MLYSYASSRKSISFGFFFRLYLINSPVVRAENLRFKEEGVRDVLKDVFLPWYNAYRFFAQQKELFEKVRCYCPITFVFLDCFS